MATDKTRSIAARVPVDVAAALREDAADLGITPGTVVRQMLEARYSARRKAGKADRMSARIDKIYPETVEFE